MVGALKRGVDKGETKGSGIYLNMLDLLEVDKELNSIIFERWVLGRLRVIF